MCYSFHKRQFSFRLDLVHKGAETENKLILVEFALNKKYISFVSNTFRLVSFKKITHMI